MKLICSLDEKQDKIYYNVSVLYNMAHVNLSF